MALDFKGRELKVGDRIMIPYVITHIWPGDDFYNIDAQSVFGRADDDIKEHFSGNSRVALLTDETH